MIDEITAFENYVQDAAAQEHIMNATQNIRSEREVRREVHDAALAQGWPILALIGSGYEGGWPDYLIVLPGGRACFAELKREGQHSRKLQTVLQERLRRAGAVVVTDCTSWQMVVEALRAEGIEVR